MALAGLIVPACGAGTWSFHEEPALRSGRPHVLGKSNGSTATLTAQVLPLDGKDTSPLEAIISTSGTTARIDFPEFDEDTCAEINIFAEPGKKLFSWRTLVRPKGQAIVNYHGRKKMLPPPDFDKYWDRALHDLKKVPLQPLVSRVPDKDTSTGLLFSVELPSVEETTVVCWYFVPRDALSTAGKPLKKCPAAMIFPGYGGSVGPADRTAEGMITLSVNPRNHGPSRKYWKSPVDHPRYHIENPETFYYRQAYLDCLRCSQFLFSRGEVDPKRVATEGSSQGGLFALATAALEPRIACVFAMVIAFSDYPDGMVLSTRGHHAQYREMTADGSTSATQILKTLSYVDGANMATRVKCPVEIVMGGVDTVCPYVCGAVVANRLPKGTERRVSVQPGIKHDATDAMRKMKAEWQRRWLKLK